MKRFRSKAILFDLDGVLVDSRKAVERHWRGWAVEHGVEPGRIFAIMHGRRTAEIIREFAPSPTLEEDARALEMAAAYDLDGVEEVAGARELLTSLQQGQWAIVTSGSRPMAEARLQHTGLPVPQVFITSADVLNGKPDPEGYLKAASLLGITPAECVIIEDAPAGLSAARAAGIFSIAVATTAMPEELREADMCIPSLASLRAEQISTPQGAQLEIVASALLSPNKG